MAEITKIQWTDHTFNPWIGCTKVHTGCANCYAEADMDKRRHRVQWGPNGTRSKTSEAYWKDPHKWAMQARNRYANWMRACAGSSGEYGAIEPYQRPRVFCASLADVFEDWKGPILNHKGEVMSRVEGACEVVTTMDDLRRDLFLTVDQTPELDWLLLTKRPENIRRMLSPWTYHACQTGDCPHDTTKDCDKNQSYRENVWLGTSVSDQATADRAVPELLKCHDLVPVLFLSVEPLVGPVNLGPWLGPWTCNGEAGVGNHDGENGPTSYCGSICRDRGKPLGPVDWVIIGGESGPNARPCNPTWVKDIVDQCRATGVACFVKQLGGNVLDFSGAIKDKKGGDMYEWPKELRVREWPEVSST